MHSELGNYLFFYLVKLQKSGGQVNEIQTYIAGKFIGGAHSISPVSSTIENLGSRVSLSAPRVELLDTDVLITWEVAHKISQ